MSTQNEKFDISFGSSNIVNDGYNTNVSMTCPFGTYNLDGYDACISNLTITNAFPTFQSATSFTITQPTFAGSSTLTVNIPVSSSYTIPEFNGLIESVCLANNFYLIETSTGDYYYFINVSFNETTGRVDVLFKNVPIALPAGYTNPGAMTFPLVASWAQLNITDATVLQVLGFASANPIPSTVPSGGINTVQSGTLYPQETLYDSLLVFCNACQNSTNTFTNRIDGFTITSGKNVYFNYAPNNFNWVKCSGNYNVITLGLRTQEGAYLRSLDYRGLSGNIVFKRRGYPIG